MSKVHVVLKPGGFVTLSLIAMLLVVIGVFLVATQPEKFQWLSSSTVKPVVAPSSGASPTAAPTASPSVVASSTIPMPAGAKSLTQWLVLRPIPSGLTYDPKEPDEQKRFSMAKMLDRAQLPNEPQLDPRAGEAVTVGKTTLKWTPVTAAALDLNSEKAYTTAQTGPPNVVGYAVTTVDMPSAVSDATLYVGSDDGVVLWLNGTRVWRNPMVRGCNPTDDKITPLSLKAGRNVLVFKVGQGEGEWRLNAALVLP